jgi:hypothetical protein
VSGMFRQLGGERPFDNLFEVINPNGENNAVNFSINGERQNANHWTIDGADNVNQGSNFILLDYPSMDSIAEFKVLRAMYDAEVGRGDGGRVNLAFQLGSALPIQFRLWRVPVPGNSRSPFARRSPFRTSSRLGLS